MQAARQLNSSGGAAGKQTGRARLVSLESLDNKQNSSLQSIHLWCPPGILYRFSMRYYSDHTDSYSWTKCEVSESKSKVGHGRKLQPMILLIPACIASVGLILLLLFLYWVTGQDVAQETEKWAEWAALANAAVLPFPFGAADQTHKWPSSTTFP